MKAAVSITGQNIPFSYETLLSYYTTCGQLPNSVVDAGFQVAGLDNPLGDILNLTSYYNHLLFGIIDANSEVLTNYIQAVNGSVSCLRNMTQAVSSTEYP